MSLDIAEEIKILSNALTDARDRAFCESEVAALSRSEAIRNAVRPLRHAAWIVVGLLAAVVVLSAGVSYAAGRAEWALMQLGLVLVVLAIGVSVVSGIIRRVLAQRYSSAELWDTWTREFLEAADRAQIPRPRAKYLFSLGTYQRRFWLNLSRALWTPLVFLLGMYWGKETLQAEFAGFVQSLPIFAVILVGFILFTIHQIVAATVYHREHLEAALEYYVDHPG